MENQHQPSTVFNENSNINQAPGESMNSQMNEALSNFINSNSSAIEKAMENENTDMSKGEPVLSELMNYLCPTPQAQREPQAMSFDDKAPLHDPNFSSILIQQTSQNNQFVQPAQTQQRVGEGTEEFCNNQSISVNQQFGVAHVQNSHSTAQHFNNQQLDQSSNHPTSTEQYNTSNVSNLQPSQFSPNSHQPSSVHTPQSNLSYNNQTEHPAPVDHSLFSVPTGSLSQEPPLYQDSGGGNHLLTNHIPDSSFSNQTTNPTNISTNPSPAETFQDSPQTLQFHVNETFNQQSQLSSQFPSSTTSPKQFQDLPQPTTNTRYEEPDYVSSMDFNMTTAEPTNHYKDNEKMHVDEPESFHPHDEIGPFQTPFQSPSDANYTNSSQIQSSLEASSSLNSQNNAQSIHRSASQSEFNVHASEFNQAMENFKAVYQTETYSTQTNAPVVSSDISAYQQNQTAQDPAPLSLSSPLVDAATVVSVCQANSLPASSPASQISTEMSVTSPFKPANELYDRQSSYHSPASATASHGSPTFEQVQQSPSNITNSAQASPFLENANQFAQQTGFTVENKQFTTTQLPPHANPAFKPEENVYQQPMNTNSFVAPQSVNFGVSSTSNFSLDTNEYQDPSLAQNQQQTSFGTDLNMSFQQQQQQTSGIGLETNRFESPISTSNFQQPSNQDQQVLNTFQNTNISTNNPTENLENIPFQEPILQQQKGLEFQRKSQDFHLAPEPERIDQAPVLRMETDSSYQSSQAQVAQSNYNTNNQQISRQSYDTTSASKNNIQGFPQTNQTTTNANDSISFYNSGLTDPNTHNTTHKEISSPPTTVSFSPTTHSVSQFSNSHQQFIGYSPHEIAFQTTDNSAPVLQKSFDSVETPQSYPPATSAQTSNPMKPCVDTVSFPQWNFEESAQLTLNSNNTLALPNKTKTSENFTNQTLAFAENQNTSGNKSNSNIAYGHFNLPSETMTKSESFPQPMQIQEVVQSVPAMALQQIKSASISESAMDVSSNVSIQRPDGQEKITYEEIHMSIVKAGNDLSAPGSDIKEISSHVLLNKNILANIIPGNSKLESKSEQPTLYIAESKPVSSNQMMTINQTSPMITPVTMTTDYIQVNMAPQASYPVTQPQDQNTMTNLLKSIQRSAAASTFPNFLEPMLSSIRSSGTESGLNSSTNQHQFAVAMTATSALNSQPLIASSGISKPKFAIIQNAGIITNTKQLGAQVGVSTALHQPEATIGSAVNAHNVLNEPKLVLPVANLPGNSVPGAAIFVNNTPLPSLTNPQSMAATTVNNPTVKALLEKANLPSSIVFPSQPAVTTTKIPTSPATQPPLSMTPSITKPHIVITYDDFQRIIAEHKSTIPAKSSSDTIIQPKQEEYTFNTIPNQPTSNHTSTENVQAQPIIQPAQLVLRGSNLQPATANSVLDAGQQLLKTREHLQILAQPGPSVDETQATKSVDDSVHKKTEPSSLFVSIQKEEQKLQLRQQPQVFQEEKLRFQVQQNSVTQQHQTIHNILLNQKLNSTDNASQPTQLPLPRKLVLQHPQQQSVIGKLAELPKAHLTPRVDMEQQIYSQTIIQQAQQQQQQLQKLILTDTVHKEPIEEPQGDTLINDYKQLHSLLTQSLDQSKVTEVSQAAAPKTTTVTQTPLQAQLTLLPARSLSSTQITQSAFTLPTQITHSSLTLPTSVLSIVSQSTDSPFHSQLNLNNTSGLTFVTGKQPVATTVPSISTNMFPSTTSVFTNGFSTPAMSSKSNITDSEMKIEDVKSLSTFLRLPKSEGFNLDKTNSTESVNTSQQQSLLAQILTDAKRSTTPVSVDLNSPPNSLSSPPSPASSPPPQSMEDSNTQATLIERSAGLQIKADPSHSMEDNENASFFDVSAFAKNTSIEETTVKEDPREEDESVPMKIHKPSLDSNTHTPVEKSFDISTAINSVGTSSFSFGSQKEEVAPGVFTFGSQIKTSPVSQSTPTKPTSKPADTKRFVPTIQVQPTSRKQKDASLKSYFSSRTQGMELKILQQPENQHRARYRTEGSRGAIKDISQQGFPTVKLYGYNKPTVLQVFIGDECGRAKPHGFYQACRVFGKNATTCGEKEIEGTTVIEIDMLPANDMTVKLDCIGILKLRNADVERRIGPKRAQDKKKNTSKARLVMRTTVEKADGCYHVLQVVSSAILCTQPVGQPEISRMSLTESTVKGGDSLFIIGKNFKNKGTTVFFQEIEPSGDSDVMWKAQAEIESDFFQPTHLICTVPPYKDEKIREAIEVNIFVSCIGKNSEPQRFTYNPSKSNFGFLVSYISVLPNQSSLNGHVTMGFIVIHPLETFL